MRRHAVAIKAAEEVRRKGALKRREVTSTEIVDVIRDSSLSTPALRLIFPQRQTVVFLRLVDFRVWHLRRQMQPNFLYLCFLFLLLSSRVLQFSPTTFVVDFLSFSQLTYFIMVITTNQATDYYDSLRQKMSHDFVWYSQV